MNNQFTQRVSDIITYSKEEANRLRNCYIGPEHLLLGLIREGGGKAIEILFNLQINLQDIKDQLENILKEDVEDDTDYDEDINFNGQASKVLKLCILEAKLMRNIAADTEHILLAIMKVKDNAAFDVLESSGVTYEKIKLTLQPDTHAGLGFSEDEDEDEDEDIRQNPSSNKSSAAQQQARPAQKKPTNDTPVLDNFGTDMTRAAEEGKLDPVVGRVKEIERLAQILSRRKKNNPILIGEPGVGKSAIVEGLALRIVEKKVSRILFDKRVIALDMTAVVAGTKYRGQFEERIRSILNELKKNPNIILFIDEIHTIVGAGSAAGSMDAANMLKPALARGEIQCIGATTLNEYRQNIEKDGALERRFQKVIVEPTTVEETLQILKNIKDKYEDHHNVNYTDAALEACVKLTDRYITDRNFPDKAIDALDEAGSRVHLTNITVPKEIEEQEKLIDEMKSLKNEAVRLQNFELAASFRDKEKEYTNQLDVLKEEWEKNLKENRETVGDEQIAEVVSMMSGVPVQRMAQAEGMKLLGMKNDLLSKVIGQDKAIATLVKAIQRSRIGLKDPNKPIGTFMFLGPTGVGKTHLAKELAKLMFGSADALIRIDMSEYMEKFTVSRLVGAPPGYVGYEEGGQLTEKVRRKPYSIVLLDEIEKAHPDVFNILLQVLDDGHITDAQGRKVDFKNTIIIMTSNAGAQAIVEPKKLGFASSDDEKQNYERMKSSVMEEVRRIFKPEFLNRIDETIVFRSLNKEDMKQIVTLMVKEVAERCKKQMNISLTVRDSVKNYIVEKAYEPKYGARPLRRKIQNEIEDKLAEEILSGSVKQNSTVIVTTKKNQIVFETI